MNPVEIIIRMAAAWLVAVLGSIWWIRRHATTLNRIALHIYVDGVERPASFSPPERLEETPLMVTEADPEPPTRQPMRFLIDSLLIYESFKLVCGTPQRTGCRPVNGFREVFHYATGMKVDPQTYVVTKIIPVQFSQQSAGGVRVADRSNIETLGMLDELGLPLVAHFHSHPGFGREANRPSHVDRGFQERLERGGHIAIGGIFSRSGHLRFFAGDLDRFVVEVVGKNVRKVGDNEFQLLLGDGHDQSRSLAVG